MRHTFETHSIVNRTDQSWRVRKHFVFDAQFRVTEAMNPNNEMFGVLRLREFLLGKHKVPLETLQRAILEAARTFSRGANQADDITLLLARYQAD